MTLVDSFAQPNTSVAEPFPLCLERPLGAVVTETGTQFALWAPSAKKVTLRLFMRGSMGEDGDALIGQYLMRPETDGSWTYDFADNKHGVYYDFLIERDCGSVDRVADPWARGAGVNGRRSMVVDFNRTNPDDWEHDVIPDVPLAQTVVWETHVGDFSNDPAGGFPESHRGKYLAFTDDGTSLEGHPDFPTGLAYLKKLGVTAVQLMPIYDFGSVDETTCDRYNWGYDPINYNVPEGSYSTNPFDGTTRIREVKQMVQALHSAGIKVIVDVVYNHMFSTDNWFERTVPKYFLRRKPNGAFANGSGCGCDMATERKMFRRFIVESVTFWAREYHMDGFRFDLMGLIDVDTMNAVRAALNEIPGRGRDILMYGEPWSAGASAPLPADTLLAGKQGLAQLDDRIGHFCDTTRDTIKGHVFYSDRPGYVNGGMHANAVAVREAVDAWRHSDRPEGVAGQVIQYVSAHDDLTLWDKLCASLAASSLGSAVAEGDEENTVDVPKALHDADFSEQGLDAVGPEMAQALRDVLGANRLSAGIVLTSAGIPFMLSGEEFARTKYGNSDSYDSTKELNWLDWNRAWHMRDLIGFYAKLIALRKSDARWFDGNRKIVDTEGDELVFRVGDYLVAVNPSDRTGVVDVAAAAVEGDSGEMHRYWCCLGVSGRGGGVSTGGGDDDYLIMPAHTFAIWRLQ